MNRLRLGTVLVAAVLTGCSHAQEVQVAAAISLREPLSDLGGEPIRFHFAASGVILRQALEGAPFDVVVLAGSEEMDRLEEGGATGSGSRAVIATNRLVLAVPAWNEPVGTLEELTLPRFSRIAIGSPSTVPVGRYASQALRRAGLWDALEKRLILAGHALQVLDYLTRDEVDAGLIYRSDALASAGVRICLEIDPDGHDPIRYEAAVLRQARDPAAARRFVERLAGPRGEVVLRRYGFGAGGGGPVIGDALRLSVQVSVTATAAVAVAGTLLGWLLARGRFRGREALDALLTLPLILPPTVTGYYLLVLLGRNGWIGGPLRDVAGVTITFTWPAAAVASAVVALPLMVRAARTAIESVSPDLEFAAATLGAGRWERFRRVTLPLARRGLLAGVVLAFARAAGEFGATLMIAGNIPGRTQTMPLAIWEAVLAGNDGRARVLVLLLTGLSVVVLVVAARLGRGRS